jgi:Flp pilus assembly protein TadD
MGTQFATLGDAESDPTRRRRYHESALAEYRTMTSINPEDPDGWFGSGVMQMSLGDTTDARRLFGEALRRRPRHARALNDMGVIFFREGNLDSAAYYFNRTLQVDSLFAEPVGNLGAIALVRGDARTALEYFDRALKIEPFRPSVLENRRKAYLLLGDSVRANGSAGAAPPGMPRP